MTGRYTGKVYVEHLLPVAPRRSTEKITPKRLPRRRARYVEGPCFGDAKPDWKKTPIRRA